MEILVQETGEIKALAVVDNKGIEWTQDFINAADFEYNGEYVVLDAEQYEYWHKACRYQNMLEAAIIWAGSEKIEGASVREYLNNSDDLNCSTDIIDELAIKINYLADHFDGLPDYLASQFDFYENVRY